MIMLPIVRPRFPDLAGSLRHLVGEILATGQVTNHGKWVQEFERCLTDYLGVETIAFCNGQTALMVMLRAAGIEGGEVICPSFTWLGTPAAVRWCGGEPVYADIREDTLTLDPADVKRRITKHTTAILSVDAYGLCSDYDALNVIARQHGLLHLCDSAPAFGSRVNGRLTGNFCDAQMFSFHATKPFTTMEGGAISSRHGWLLDEARDIRNFGLQKNGGTYCGLNGKMMEIPALVGVQQLEGFDEIADRRRLYAREMAGQLRKIPGLSVPQEGLYQEPVWTYLPVLVDAVKFGMDRDALHLALLERHVQTRKYYWPPCHWDDPLSDGHELPVTERVAGSVLALPVYNDMNIGEADSIMDKVRLAHRERVA